MRNWKMIGAVSVIVIAAATAAALAYAPSGGPVPDASPQNLVVAPRVINMSYAPSHKDAIQMRVAQSCIDHGQTCTLHGTPCCNSTDTCKGPFPNTTCQ